MRKIKVKTETYYPVPDGPTCNWTEKDWGKVAIKRSEPRRIKAMGHVWRAIGRDDKGKLVYLRAEPI